MGRVSVIRAILLGVVLLALPAGAHAQWTEGPYLGSRGNYLADVTGDGMADAIVVNDDRITVRRSAGNRFSGNESWTNEPYYSTKSDKLTFFADVTGDGRADAIVVDDNRVTVRRSTGSGFGGYEGWTEGPYYSFRSDDLLFFADVTGDGRADAIVVDDNRVTVRRSTGSDFSGNENWTNEPYLSTKSDKLTFFADVTGDGRADAIVVDDNRVTVRRSTGSGFGRYEGWTEGPYYSFKSDDLMFFADVTGDGRADAIVVDDNRVTVRRSTGSGFSGNENWTNEPYYSTMSDDLMFFADVTGDGRADAIVVDYERVHVRPSTGGGFAR